MSYSFGIQADSKGEVAGLVEAELDKVVASQPIHENDRKVAQDAAEACVEQLVEPGEGEVVSVSVSGSLGWRAEGEFTSANVSVSASVRQKL